MTYPRSVLAVVLAALALATACDDTDDLTGVNGNTATVRFVNATGNTNLSVANAGTVATGNANLGFGGSSTCMSVNSSATGTSGLSFTNASTGAAIAGFTPTFAAGGNYTVVAYTDASGATQFVTLNNSFTPTTGQAGLRVFNAASGSGNIVANSGTTALGTGVGFGTAGSFVSVPVTTQSITFNTGTGTTTLGTASGLNFTAGQNYTLILAPATSGSTTRRTTLVAGC